jgi:DNA polymerase III alpha subunit (gram-positive type)
MKSGRIKSMARLLGIDLETTGLDPALDRIIEIGFIGWETEKQTPVFMKSFFVDDYFSEVPVSAEIEQLTGITQSLVSSYAKPIAHCYETILDFSPSFLVAHNAKFERSFLEGVRTDCVESSQAQAFKAIPWIDTKTDIPYSPMKGMGSLSEIAMSHGIFNPLPHRALTDTLAMMQILAKYDIQQVIKYAEAPVITLVANVSFEDKDKAKALGYYWDGKQRLWSKPVKAFRYEEELHAAAQKSMSVYVLEEKQ